MDCLQLLLSDYWLHYLNFQSFSIFFFHQKNPKPALLYRDWIESIWNGRESMKADADGLPNRELYALLNISPEASTEEIRKAYRQWAQVYHPDKYQAPQVSLRMHIYMFWFYLFSLTFSFCPLVLVIYIFFEYSKLKLLNDFAVIGICFLFWIFIRVYGLYFDNSHWEHLKLYSTEYKWVHSL